LIENNRILIIFVKLMDIRENCGIREDGDGGRILSKRGMETGMGNILDGGVKSGKVSFRQSPPR
jgi:hypothetical protein